MEIVKILRAPGGCPWDMAQTHQSIRSNFIEETYEAIEAIDNGDTALLREELGDVLLQVALHAEMEREAGAFDINDVCNDLCQKLIVRHPHVFGDKKADDEKDALQNWNAVKMKTKNQKTQTEAMESVCRALPALMRSEKIQRKSAKVGFDWDAVDGALDKLYEEYYGLRVAIARALVNNPRMIVADEPTGNLDPVRSLELMLLFEKINEMGTTVLVVTHEKELVNAFSKRVVAIDAGQVISDGMDGYFAYE